MRKTIRGILAIFLLCLGFVSCDMLTNMSGIAAPAKTASISYDASFASATQNLATGTMTTNFAKSGTAVSTNGLDQALGSKTAAAADAASPTGSVGYAVQNYQVGATYSSLAILNPQTSVVYPGAALIGSSIPTGAYTQIVDGVRAPITLSSTITGGISSVKIQNPNSLSEVTNAINTLITLGGSGSTNSVITFDQSQVSSSSTLNVAVGANFDYEGAAKFSAAGSFNYDTSKSTTNILVRCQQVYYSISVDALTAANFYKTAPNLSSLGTVSPVYVASVNYGRLAYFGFSSTDSATNLAGALNAAFSYGGASGSLSLSVAQKATLAASTINSTIIGGGSGSNTAVTSLDGFLNFIHTGGTFSKDNPGSPISYTLKYAKDNSVAGTLLYSSYAVRTPVYQPVDGEFTVKYTSESSSSGCTFSGTLYVASEDDQSPKYSSGWVKVWDTGIFNGGVANGNINASITTTFQSDPNIAKLNVSDLHVLLTCNPGWANGV